MNFSEGTQNGEFVQARRSLNFSSIKVNTKTLSDAILSDVSAIRKTNSKFGDKHTVLTALNSNDINTLIEISNFYMRVSGIYSRLVRYMAYLYRYDWEILPYTQDKKVPQSKVLDGFYKATKYFENSSLKRTFGHIALAVVRDGSYYGYQTDSKDQIVFQDLPNKYCRSRFTVSGRPAVEFNMRYFDDTFKDIDQRLRVLQLFPSDFKKGYAAYKEGKLPPQYEGDTAGWYLLDVDHAIKFNIHDSDLPLFISIIPAILDLDAAQGLDRKKMEQQLLKIIIQKLPIDKNGELVFDTDEAQELHNNAVKMLQEAIGVDVLTTFADVNVADMSDRSSVTSIDQLEKVERTVYNESGTAQNLFNTSGNTALEKSILNDEASIYSLVLQFEDFLNYNLKRLFEKPKFYFRAQILPTTIYNYKDMVKLYKDQVASGYSKFLPAIALGQSQSSILAALTFENDILDLPHAFIPPLSSNTMTADSLKEESKTQGRPEKPDDEKSDKTLQNRESMS